MATKKRRAPNNKAKANKVKRSRIVRAAVKAASDPRTAIATRQHLETCRLLESLNNGLERLFAERADSRQRRAPLGFGDGVIEPNTTRVFTAGPLSHDYVPERLIVVGHAAGLIVEAIDSGVERFDINVPAELYGSGVIDPPESFPVFPYDAQPSITIRNPTANAINVSIGMKGRLESPAETVLRQRRELALLRAQLLELGAERLPAAAENEDRPGAINGLLNEHELSDVKRSIAPLDARPLVISGQE